MDMSAGMNMHMEDHEADTTSSLNTDAPNDELESPHRPAFDSFAWLAIGLSVAAGAGNAYYFTKSAQATKEQTKIEKEYALEPQLGKRIDYVEIRREADCISIKPRGWLPKPIWREINDILFINGFSWLENGKESKWIKLKQQERPAYA
jgi:hypothetical protein